MPIKDDHCTIRNGNFFCSNCGGEQVVKYPIHPEMFRAMSSAFRSIHRYCPKTWEQPLVDQGLSERQKADFWLSNGERGISSETMFQVIDGRNILRFPKSHPLDPDDFRRCHLLLETIPEWKPKLNLMKEVSPVWNRLVENWDKLTEMLLEQLKTHKPNGMYEFMKELGC